MEKKEIFRALKYTIIAASAGVIQIVSDTLLYEVAHFPAYLSALIALVLSVIWNFTINRKFTFRSNNNVIIAMLKVAGYYLVFTPLSTWWTNILVDQGNWNNYLVLGITMLINFVTEYLFTKYIVYGKNIDNAEKK